jgi:redox-sensitive bicupin YhaK (pirin superfamily)
MLEIRKSDDRGLADHHDPEHMGFGDLRVINEDRIQPGTGFGTHGHRDMEIISYVLEGALAHKDNMGNGSTIVPGDVQRMSAGKGVLHSEFNQAKDGVTHFLQIWIEPGVKGIAPSYEQKHFDADSKRGKLKLVGSPDGREGSVTIHQDAFLYAGLLDGADRATHALKPGRRAYVHVARGRLTANGQALDAGDALKLADAAELVLERAKDAEVLVFDLA